MSGAEWVLPLVTTILGGGVLGGIAILLKVRPEASSLAVVASEKVVVLQMSTITRLEEELDELRQLAHEVHDLRNAQAASEARIEEMQRRLDAKDREKDTLVTENAQLKERVRTLEDQVAELKANQPPAG